MLWKIGVMVATGDTDTGRYCVMESVYSLEQVIKNVRFDKEKI